MGTAAGTRNPPRTIQTHLKGHFMLNTKPAEKESMAALPQTHRVEITKCRQKTLSCIEHHFSLQTTLNFFVKVTKGHMRTHTQNTQTLTQ